MQCLHIPEISYGDFCRRLAKRSNGRRMPWLGSMELTARCNLRCLHCYINCSATDSAEKNKELTSTEWRNLTDQIEAEGTLSLLLTGGEPLVRNDFRDIYAYVKKKGLLVTLFTNGTLITPELADYLAEWPPRSVEITLYGATRGTYEAVTRVPGSHARCLNGIQLLLERRIPVSLKTMLLSVNMHELDAMKAYASERGLSFRYDWCINPRLDGGRSPLEFRVSPEDAVSVEQEDEARMRDLKQFSDKFGHPPLHPENLYFCAAGLTSFHVDPYGGLSACMMSRVPSFDLRKGSFHQGWMEFVPQVLSQKRELATPCQSCDLVFLCGQCPAWGQLESGDPELPVEYLCRLAHLRAEAIHSLEREKAVPDEERGRDAGKQETLQEADSDGSQARC